MAEQKRAFVTGWPINHSRSPIIHNYWLEKYGLAGSYEKFPCEPENLAGFLTQLAAHGFVGGNVTVPHKEEAYQLAEQIEPVAQAIGAVNTMWLADGKLHATNTDAYGFLANLDERAPGWDSPEKLQRGALVLGAGGASRAIIHALVERGFTSIKIANRTVSKAEILAEQFGPTCHGVALEGENLAATDPAIIINTTAIGMNDGRSPIELAEFSTDTLVHDIVYTPLITPMLEQAQARGMPVVDGLGMLLHQAVPGFELWFGVRPEVDDQVRQLVLADMGVSQ